MMTDDRIIQLMAEEAEITPMQAGLCLAVYRSRNGSGLFWVGLNQFDLDAPPVLTSDPREAHVWPSMFEAQRFIEKTNEADASILAGGMNPKPLEFEGRWLVQVYA